MGGQVGEEPDQPGDWLGRTREQMAQAKICRAKLRFYLGAGLTIAFWTRVLESRGRYHRRLSISESRVEGNLIKALLAVRPMEDRVRCMPGWQNRPVRCTGGAVAVSACCEWTCMMPSPLLCRVRKSGLASKPAVIRHTECWLCIDQLSLIPAPSRHVMP